jgi:hypothetical protein
MTPFDAVMSRAVQSAHDSSVSMCFGRVKAVTGNTITVNVGGVDVPNVPAMKQYTASVGEWAWCLRQGTLLVAIGCSKGIVNDERKGPPDE